MVGLEVGRGNGGAQGRWEDVELEVAQPRQEHRDILLLLLLLLLLSDLERNKKGCFTLDAACLFDSSNILLLPIYECSYLQ